MQALAGVEVMTLRDQFAAKDVFDAMVVRYVSLPELVQLECRESYIPSFSYRPPLRKLPNEYGVDFDLGRRFVLVNPSTVDVATD